MLQGKKIILGVTGSIAAYKSAQLIRLLVKEGADVKVIYDFVGKGIYYPAYACYFSKKIPYLSIFF